jgi:DNA-binding transcriptional LysR family regulator
MDRLDELSVFLAVLDAGGLAAAARSLGRSPPAVTRILAALEARIGERLIERTTRKLAPTEAGRRLAEDARRVLAAYDAALFREDAEELKGSLRVTAPLVFGRRHVTPVVASFLQLHPRLAVELLLHDRNLDLIDEGLDVALRIGALADSSLVARRVGEVRRLLVAAPDYVRRRGAPDTPADLAAHAAILSNARGLAPEWRFGPHGAASSVRLAPRLTINDIEAVLAVVRDGHGVTQALSYQVADDLKAGRLVRLLRAYEPAPVPVQLVTLSARHMPRRIRAFLDHAAAELSKLPVLRPEPDQPPSR